MPIDNLYYIEPKSGKVYRYVSHLRFPVNMKSFQVFKSHSGNRTFAGHQLLVKDVEEQVLIYRQSAAQNLLKSWHSAITSPELGKIRRPHFAMQSYGRYKSIFFRPEIEKRDIAYLSKLTKPEKEKVKFDNKVAKKEKENVISDIHQSTVSRLPEVPLRQFDVDKSPEPGAKNLPKQETAESEKLPPVMISVEKSSPNDTAEVAKHVRMSNEPHIIDNDVQTLPAIIDEKGETAPEVCDDIQTTEVSSVTKEENSQRKGPKISFKTAAKFALPSAFKNLKHGQTARELLIPNRSKSQVASAMMRKQRSKKRRRSLNSVDSSETLKVKDALNSSTLENEIKNDENWLEKHCIVSERIVNSCSRIFHIVNPKGSEYIGLTKVMKGLMLMMPDLASDKMNKQYLENICCTLGLKFEQSGPHYSLNFPLFTIVAAVGMKIADISEGLKIFLAAKVQYRDVDNALFKLRMLWSICCDKETNRVGAERLQVLLDAGGFTMNSQEISRSKFPHGLDFVDFLAYSPLFLFIHRVIVNNPLSL